MSQVFFAIYLKGFFLKNNLKRISFAKLSILFHCATVQVDLKVHLGRATHPRVACRAVACSSYPAMCCFFGLLAFSVAIF